MSTIEIDYLTKDFYKAISFRNSQPPEFDTLDILFYEDGTLVNNSFSEPIDFTTSSFVEAMQSQVASGDMEQFMQREIFSKTEVFGKIAQRISVYEYNFSDQEVPRMPRGINFILFIQVEGNWRIVSMAWNDENENHVIPEEYLRGS